ncbi:serine hydrolase domain-containing protein [Microbacterium telephonicum]|uniref:D-alanyl-D-alanine carboxypeptidase n=1 Tax=Microbacterium telephonicum TaxID=1714841 RepID=A0A498C2I2_9MICO|nr:serine hydrolase domain-containing protein [Microbacterium telephonicum]RLK49433.1 D-alanyl-D-alanine carboxypeptidase [Microbacterium telephonicum]
MKRRAKIALGVVSGVAAMAVAAAGALAYLNRPLSRAELDREVEALLQKAVAEEPTLTSALLTVHRDGDDRALQYAVGVQREGGEAVTVHSAYHSASVGKTMLAVVYGQLVDEGVMSFGDPITGVLDPSTLEGLFVVDGVDHAADVTFGALLGHTSGVADYFEGPVTSGMPIIDEIAADPDRRYTPESLLAFSRERQHPVGVPGERFSYSDTGYILLGLALERIEGKPYAQILEDRLFAPLAMESSRLMTEFGPGSGIVALRSGDLDLSERGALSVDWSGGGVVTTMDDLLSFSRALHGGVLVSERVRRHLTDFASEMDTGIRYGMGMMQFRFSELSPLLFTMSDVHGAVGATGTFALYDPSSGTHYIANFGSLDYAEKAIEKLVEIRLLVDRLR